MTPPEDAAAFGHEIAAILASTLAGELVGAYFVGSIALGGYVRGESDIDIVAVCRHEVGEEAKRALADRLLEATINCPARGLEFTLYRDEVASSPPKDADFELNVNGGPRMARQVRLSSHTEPRFWYVLDRGIATAMASRSPAFLRQRPSHAFPGNCCWRLWSSRCDGIASTRRQRSTPYSTPAALGASPSRTF